MKLAASIPERTMGFSSEHPSVEPAGCGIMNNSSNTGECFPRSDRCSLYCTSSTWDFTLISVCFMQYHGSRSQPGTTRFRRQRSSRGASEPSAYGQRKHSPQRVHPSDLRYRLAWLTVEPQDRTAYRDDLGCQVSKVSRYLACLTVG